MCKYCRITCKYFFWNLYFDGSKFNDGVGVGCILVRPKGENIMLAYTLKFECTNIVAEYEALIRGLQKDIILDVKFIKVFCDPNIVVKQVRNNIHCVSNLLKHYQYLVQDLTSHFLEFNISLIPRIQNSNMDLLANIASKIIPLKDFSLDRFSIELIF